MAKRLISVRDSKTVHWVGDGFPVRTLFSYVARPGEISPFLLLDHAGPHAFPPGGDPRGVDSHPHRGIETVTLVYQGDIEHLDSAGGGGRIGAGGVQWMTAASGIVHEERHGAGFTREGGTFESIQLWVNLRARDKGAAPAYQAFAREDIPEVKRHGFTARVIAGEMLGVRGPARTFTPIELVDLDLEGGARLDLDLPAGHTCLVLVRGGRLTSPDSREIESNEVGVFASEGAGLALEAIGETRALVMAGEPIDEPIVGHGPFVMNTREEIRQAIRDYAEAGSGDVS